MSQPVPGRPPRRPQAVARTWRVVLDGGNTGSVAFIAARPRALGDRRRRVLGVVVLVAYALWAAALAFSGHGLLGGATAAVFAEFALARTRAARVTGGVVDDAALARRVEPMILDLCSRAGCAVPMVALRDDSIRPAAVYARRGQMSLLLSRPLAARISDAELRALLAHEVAHIVHADSRAALTRVKVATVVAWTAMFATILGTALDPLLLPIWTAVFLVTMYAALAALAPLNRAREVRADIDGARLAADPGALARALDAAQTVSHEVRRQIYGRPPLRWLLAPLAWNMPSHPPTSRRIARLNELAAAESAASA